jgi:hypothetical protein
MVPGAREIVIRRSGNANAVLVQHSYAAAYSKMQGREVLPLPQSRGTRCVLVSFTLRLKIQSRELISSQAAEVETATHCATWLGLACCLAESGACCCAVM